MNLIEFSWCPVLRISVLEKAFLDFAKTIFESFIYAATFEHEFLSSLRTVNWRGNVCGGRASASCFWETTRRGGKAKFVTQVNMECLRISFSICKQISGFFTMWWKTKMVRAWLFILKIYFRVSNFSKIFRNHLPTKHSQLPATS